MYKTYDIQSEYNRMKWIWTKGVCDREDVPESRGNELVDVADVDEVGGGDWLGNPGWKMDYWKTASYG